jgi:hypothetical protein
MKIKYLAGGLLSVGLILGSISGPAADKPKTELKAKISKAKAIEAALARVPGGKVTDSELEEENGKLIWSFDISTKGSKDITEVQVDAATGEVISVVKETPAEKEKIETDKVKAKK